jgi:hypothetical protein
MLYHNGHCRAVLLLSFTAALILSFQLTSEAQQSTAPPCTLNVEELPEIRGFKLGMTLEDIRRRHPKFKIPEPDETGYAEMTYSVSYYLSYGEESLINEEDRKGITGIKVAFLDGKLVRLRIIYDDSVKWKDVPEFLQAMIRALKLPDAKFWINHDADTAQLNCNNVVVQVRLIQDARNGGSIAFGQLGIDKTRTERARSIEAKKKQGFKP